MNFPKPIRRTASCLAIAIVTLPIMLKVWQAFRSVIPLPIFFDITEKMVFITLIAQCLFLPALLISSLKIWIKISLGVLFIPVCLLYLVLFLQSPEHIANSVKVSKRNIYLVDFLEIPKPRTTYFLYECNSQDLQCKKVDGFFLSGGLDLYDTEFVVDNDNIHLFAGGELVFTYGRESRNYDLLDWVVLGNYTYSLAISKYTAPHTLALYRSLSDTEIGLEVLPFKYTADKFRDIELKVDNQKGEIYVVVDDQLIYRHGSTPQCFVENCFTSSE